MSEMPVPEDADATEVYDKSHGRPMLADEQKAVNLSEAANKPPPQAQSFRVSGGK